MKRKKEKRSAAEYFEAISPPGMSLRFEWSFIIVGAILSFIYSLGFLFRYANARSDLFEYRMDGGVSLKKGAQIEPFVEILEDAPVGFLIVAICALIFIFLRYSYFHQGSRSIYLMRRLPDKGLRHRMCIKAPVLYFFMTLGACACVIVLYLAIFLIFTPIQCL